MSFKQYFVLVLGGLGISLFSQVYASAYSISPLMLVAGNNDKIMEFRLTNTSDKSVPVQIQVKKWSQKDNRDIYVKTFDLLTTPMKVELQPKKTQYFRISVVVPNHSVDMKAYRLFVRELPTPLVKQRKSSKNIASLQSDTAKLNVLLDISIPVLLQPKVPLKETFTWHYDRLKNNRYRVVLDNTGNSVIKLTHLNIVNYKSQSIFNKTLLQYILPKHRHSWTITLPHQPYNITAKINGETITTQATVDRT